MIRSRGAPYDRIHALIVALLLAGLVWYLGCAGSGRQSGRELGGVDSVPPGGDGPGGYVNTGPVTESPDPGDPDPGGLPPGGPLLLQSTGQMLILCWDGAQYDHVMTALREGELPNLARIIRAGGVSETLITDHATETKSAHAQMFTGYGPDITGNASGQQFQPLARELSVFGRLNQHFGADGIQQIWVTSKSVRVSSLPGEVWQYCRLDFDIWDGDIHRECDVTGPLIISYLKKAVHPGERFLFFGHFTEPDTPGHAKGENSTSYHQSIVMLDRWLGRILAVLDALGLADTTAVCVCTDHGFDEGKYTHENSPDAWFATDLGALRPVGDQKDVAPTILSAFGVDVTALDPPMPGSPLWAEGEATSLLRPGGTSVGLIARPASVPRAGSK